MANKELAEFIAEFVMISKDTILEAFEKDDVSIIEDDAFEFLDGCDGR
ncbi:MAG: hypothetical protein K0S04_1392 [Herbinix sp.]|nr:hypothetical protein [Herbinix sp.]